MTFNLKILSTLLYNTCLNEEFIKTAMMIMMIEVEFNRTVYVRDDQLRPDALANFVNFHLHNVYGDSLIHSHTLLLLSGQPS